VSAAPIRFEVEEPTAGFGAWRDQARCQGSTHLFFAPPVERPGRKARREGRARALCACCPVQPACRSWARTHREFGFWGGETEEERTAAGYRPSLRGVAARRDDEPTPDLAVSA